MKTLDIHDKPYNRTIMVTILMIGTFAGVLMGTSLGTALPTLMSSFDISLATAQQATTWFLLFNGIMIPVSAYLSVKFPTKNLYITAYSLLLIGFLISALSPTDNWSMFLLGRIIAAIAVGITMPLMQVVIAHIFPPEERGVTMGISGLVVGMAPAIGPTLSGWILLKEHNIFGITFSNSWRNIFFLPSAVLFIVLILSIFFIKDVVPNKNIKLDMISLIESTVGFGLFLFAFTNVATYGWTDVKNVVLPGIIGTIFIIIFSKRQFSLKIPFLNLRVFESRQFLFTTLLGALAMMSMMGVEMMLPPYLQTIRQISAFHSGLMLLPGALVMGIMSPVAGYFFDKIGVRRLAIFGFITLLLSTLPFVFITATMPEVYIIFFYSMRMFGIALVMMPLTAASMFSLSKDDIPSGTAVNNTARQLSSSIIVALLSSVTQNVMNNNKPSKSLLNINPFEFVDKMTDASILGFKWAFIIALLITPFGIWVSFFLDGHKKTAKEEI